MSQDPELSDVIKQLQEAYSTLSTAQYKKGAYFPYYKVEYAEAARAVIDSVVTTGQPQFIPCVTEQGQIGLSTLRNKWSQATKYLLEHLDPEGRYSKLLAEKLQLRIRGKHGIVISPIKRANTLKGLTLVDWRPDFLKYMDEADTGDTFERIGIALTPDDLSWVNEHLAPVKDLFVSEVSLSGIIIVRQ